MKGVVKRVCVQFVDQTTPVHLLKIRIFNMKDFQPNNEAKEQDRAAHGSKRLIKTAVYLFQKLREF